MRIRNLCSHFGNSARNVLPPWICETSAKHLIIPDPFLDASSADQNSSQLVESAFFAIVATVAKSALGEARHRYGV